MTHHQQLRFSIITVVLNGEKTIEKMIESVLEQTYPEVEYTVIDGGSTDSTLSIIDKYRDGISAFVSEGDSGITEAMNKGIRLSTGDYLLFLHSDDYLLNSRTIASVARDIRENPGSEIYSYCLLFGTEGRFKKRSPRGLNPWIKLKMGILHQATFCKRSLFDRIGLFDESFKIDADYDFILRAYDAGASVVYRNRIVSVMGDSGVSSRLDRKAILYRLGEERRAHEKNSTSLFQDVFYRFYWPIYLLYRGFRDSGSVVYYL